MNPLLLILLGIGAASALLFSGGASAHEKSPHQMPDWLKAEYNAARTKAATDPANLDRVAKLLDENGFSSEAEELRGLARSRAVHDAPTSSDADKAKAAAVTATAQVLAAPVPAAIPDPATKTVSVPNAAPVSTVAKTDTGSVALTPLQILARKLSAHLNALVENYGSVAKAKGHEDTALVRTFQQQTQLKNDGSYGPKTALTLARYWGDVPIVFFWPKGSLPNTAVPKYRSDLETVALDADQRAELDRMRAKMIRLSEAREKGQGFGTGKTSVPSDSPMTPEEASRLAAEVAAAYFPRA